jgi:hypothetical protein
MSDAAVKAKTGKDWKGWFALLDKAGAKQLPHAKIAALLHKEHGVPGWWSQMVTVEYELSRGLRERHRKADGFSVSASKTVGTPLADLYEATADATVRKRWFPKGTFKPSSQTKNKYLNGAWNGARLNIGFYAKGEDKAQIALQVNKLASREDVDRERTAWKGALVKLQAVLEG